jgi:tRNA(fMet)-specific endonuclease VapC
MIYLLDTDHVSVIQRSGEAATSLVRRLRSLSPDDYGTTIVTYEEQCRGWADRIHRARTPEERIEAYACLSDNLRFYRYIAVWEYTSDVERELAAFAEVRLGTKDRRIAAIARANRATVLTRNIKDFGKVPGLLVEDWTI